MRRLSLPIHCALLAVALVGLSLRPDAPSAAADPKPADPVFKPEEIAFYEKEVLPILEANCLRCHGDGEKPKGKLRLLSRETILKGGETGPAVSLEKPENSLLLKAISYKIKLEMPPKGKLPQKDIDTLTRWVQSGLPMKPGKIVVKDTGHKPGITEESKNYWCYQPIERPPVPSVKNGDWVKNPIDAFILARMEAKGLTPAAPADKVALLRRVTYDLTGLPPTPEQVDAFVNDRSPDAYAKLIDRLLESPQYGEKWGRHWLDLVRYAETNGYERDGPKPFAWRFRDYVIQSFNADKPFDQFLKEQLAGDEIDRNNPDCIIATGYYRLGIWDDEPADPKQARFDEFDDFVATTSQVFLGMTMNCARCHDHKIDPILQKDYYAMVSFFRDVPHFSETRDTRSKFNLTDITPPDKRVEYEKELKARQTRLDELTKQTTAIEDEAIKKMPAEDQRASEGPDRPKVVQKVPQFLDDDKKAEYRKLRKEIDDLKRKPMPSQELALSVNNCEIKPPDTHVLIRGNPHNEGPQVEPSFPTVLGVKTPTIPPAAKEARTSGRRTVLAEWIAAKDNPLTARVLANRLWQYHFGRGIVPSANDFGKFGMLPTHPELLDWLASEVVDGGWKLKRMHKLIMLSNAYQMSAKASAAGLKSDPDNTLWWRYPMRRLTAEEVRDSTLAVSGRLNPKMFGPSIYPPIPREVLAGQSVPGQGWGKSPPEEASRRSIYVHVKRSLLVPILSQHDQADTDSSCPVRYTTTVPTQALGMLNGDFTNEMAGAFAERLLREAPTDVNAQVRRAIRLTTGRQPTDDEVKKDVAFVQKAGLKQYCLLALNANEFVYLD